jgi:hypothetical protein
MKLITFVFCILFLNSAFSQKRPIFLKTNTPFFDAKDNDENLLNSIKINSMELGFYRDDALASPGSGASRSYPELLTISMPFGHSTISLFQNMLDRRVGTNLEIVFQMMNPADPNPDRPNLTYQKFQFDTFVIASVEPNGIQTVDITIQFLKVFIENFEITQDSSKPLGPKTSSGWDYVQNKTWGGFVSN